MRRDSRRRRRGTAVGSGGRLTRLTPLAESLESRQLLSTADPTSLAALASIVAQPSVQADFPGFGGGGMQAREGLETGP